MIISQLKHSLSNQLTGHLLTKELLIGFQSILEKEIMKKGSLNF